MADDKAALQARAESDAIIKEVHERWPRADEAERAQRESILAAKEFRAGNQWPDSIRVQREGGQALTPQASQPARPCLTIDRISQPVRQASNAIKNANISITVLPNGEHANDETADVFTGYLRRLQNQSRGDAPIEWAADGAIESGLGWVRLRTRYVSDEATDNISAFDQELVCERITNSLSVYCDPASDKPTKSDAQFMLVVEDLSKDEFRRRYPKAEEIGIEDFADTPNMKDWVKVDMIRIAEYWRITYDPQTIVLLQDGRVVPLEQAPSGVSVIQQRVIEVPRVEWFKINAKQVLPRDDGSPDQGAWVGRRIPLFPILGEELNVDGRKVYRGIIQSAMDAQRMVNYLYSGAVETAALAPKAPWVMAEGQDEGHKAEWQTANTYNYQTLYYNPVSLGGTVLPPPKRNVEEPPIQAQVELLHLSEEAIKATTAFFDPSLGNYNAAVTSGRQTLALQKQQELSTSNFLDNVVRTMIEIGNEAVIIIPKITRKGQLLHILGVDDEPTQALTGQPHIVQNGQAVPVAPEQASQYGKGVVKFYDLNAGRYGVTVDVGKSATTMREEGLGVLGELIPHLPPPMAAALTPEFISEMSFPGAQKMAEIARKTLPPELQPQEEGGPDPRLQAAMQMVQQLQNALQSKVAEKMAVEQAKGQADMQKAQMQGQVDMAKAQQDNEADLIRTIITEESRQEVAKIAAGTQLTIADLKAQIDASQVAAEQLRTIVEAAQEQRLAHGERAHEAGHTAMQHEHDKELAEQAHQHALEQGQQAADLAPEPAEPTA